MLVLNQYIYFKCAMNELIKVSRYEIRIEVVSGALAR